MSRSTVRALSGVLIATLAGAPLTACGGRATRDGTAAGGGAGAAAHDAALPGLGGAAQDGASPGAGGALHEGSADAPAGSGGDGGAAAQSGVGGAAGVSDAGRPCVPAEDAGPFAEPACADLERLMLADPVVVDDEGDGRVSPGESFTITITLTDVSGLGFSHYPGVLVEADHVGVALDGVDWRYAVLPCGADPLSTRGTVAADVSPGTVVPVTARAAMLGRDCADAPSLRFQLRIE